MDYLWSPWRYQYVSQAGKGEGCPFCQKVALDPAQDRENLVLYRGRNNFILLNLYPYTTGHMLVTPYAHVANLDQVTAGNPRGDDGAGAAAPGGITRVL